jgi:hypothetical protein
MKIAVCISGLIRYWEETYPLFEHWNKMFPNTFVFFLSTWKGTDLWYDKERFGELEFTEHDYSKYDFIESYSLHNESDVKVMGNSLPNSWLRSYSMKQVQTLRKEYEQKNNIAFDGVFQIRNDMFISKDIIQNLLYCCTLKEFQTDKVVLTPGGTSVYLQGKGVPTLFVGNDNFTLASSQTMDKIMNLYDWMTEDKLQAKSCHKAPAEFYFKNNIHSFQQPSGLMYLYREGKMKQNVGPTPQVMKKLIDERGVDWIYNLPVHILEQEYWNCEK